jgi:uncharacterized membrane protein
MSNKKLRLEILEKMSGLMMAGFGLVAALAWNEAIQDLFKKIEIFSRNSLLSKFIYAVLVTVIIVVVTYYLGKSVDKLKKSNN